MNRDVIEVLKRINCEDLSNAQWGIVEDVTLGYFNKTKICKDRELPGTWLYVWLSPYDDREVWISCAKTDEIISLPEEDEMILLYEVEL